MSPFTGKINGISVRIFSFSRSSSHHSCRGDGSTQKTTDDGKRYFVIRFEGDVSASSVDCLREEVTAVLEMARETDEVIACIESPGGLVHAYGLAASQLTRVKSKKVSLTVSVDKVAASGGYLMAAVADKIVAAPFALVGSIGVVAQVPNYTGY